MNSKIKLLFFLLATGTFITCNSNSNTEKEFFNRSAFLTEIVGVQLIPSLDLCKNDSEALKLAIIHLIETPTTELLQTARTQWKSTFLSWQKVSPFNIGPAEASGVKKTLQEEVATFPVSVQKIETRISSSQFNLNDFDRDARGLFTLEYLLFGSAQTDEELLIKLTEDGFKSFLSAVASDCYLRISTIKDAWNMDEMSDFVANSGTDAGSSTSLFFNEYIKNFEGLKNFKVALPLGLRPGQIESEPNRVEAYYSGESISGIKAHIQVIKQIWFGPENGIGFKGYLKSVSGGADLIQATQIQFEALDSVINSIDSDEKLSDLIIQNDQRVHDLHTELQKLTRFLKSDLSSLIGISITYTSGDGD